MSSTMSQQQPPTTTDVVLFTDGGCSGNPGPGGWAFILRHPATGKESSESGAERETTNNRMELTAVVRGLARLTRRTRVELVSDSVYVGTGLSQWLPKWKLQGWKRKERGRLVPIKNEDLWRELDRLACVHDVRFRHVAGHSGHPENEACDRMAVQAYRDLISGEGR
ncbi:MAG: ribonuclease HI [Planctomycetota bacterium]|jgi:ribonuclease HI|nr:ribonuclease HI [Planctomycetota bacterium]MDA0970276.1 ribonuclease HI [Planctomycetota bacterium]